MFGAEYARFRRGAQSRLKDIQKNLQLVQDDLNHSKREAEEFSRRAAYEAKRGAMLRGVAEDTWESLSPLLQEVYRQPSMECRDGMLILDRPMTIYISPLWEKGP